MANLNKAAGLFNSKLDVNTGIKLSNSRSFDIVPL
jgi:hypothetical protein